MKQKKKRLSALLCAATLMASVSAWAAGATETVHTQLWTDRIYVNGIYVGFQNGQGRPVEAVFYNGTIYIPIRTAGEWMGCEVEWDQQAQAIRLTSGGTPKITASADLPDSTPEELTHYTEQLDNGVTITLRPDIAVYLDGSAQHFANVKGEAVYPVVLEDVTYLPVRNVGELCGLGVAWVPKAREDSRQLVALYTPLTEEQKAAVRTYQSTVTSVYEDLKTAVDAYLSSLEGLSAEGALEQLHGLEGYINQLVQVPLDIPVMEHERAALAKVATGIIEFGAVYEDIFQFNSGLSVDVEFAKTRYAEGLATIQSAMDNFSNLAGAVGVQP